jgi:hypothetical protein
MTQVQLAALESQIKGLRVKRNRLKRRFDSDESTASESLAEYAKVDCRKLCDAMYCILPREIRDTIYGYIHPGSDINVFGHQPDFDWSNTFKRSYFNFNSEAEWRLDRESHDEHHLWKEEYLGHNVLTELLQHYYRNTQFRFHDAYELIPRFQTTDQWGVGAVPADFVTNIEVNIVCNSKSPYARSRTVLNADIPIEKGFSAYSTERYVWNDHEPPPMQPRVKLLSGLQSLFGFKSGSRISIQIESGMIKDGAPQELIHVCDIIVPIIFTTLQRLHENAYVVEIVVHGNYWGMQNYRYVMEGGLPTLEAWRENFKEVSHLKCSVSDRFLTCVVQGPGDQ